MPKGSAFEREICVKLSGWWTGGKRSDIFWRTAMSGGRATVRGKQGKTTAGGYGDIAATDPIGEPLLKAFTIETKKGYSKRTLYDLLDKPKHGAAQLFEDWYTQARKSMLLSKSLSWLIITRRDRRVPIILMPLVAFQNVTICKERAWPKPYLTYKWLCTDDIGAHCNEQVIAMRLDSFLDLVQPQHIKQWIGRV